MSIEGKIIISMAGKSRGYAKRQGIEIRSSRKTNIANFLTGKPPEEAIEILPAIFSICGKAHAFAAAKACGQPSINNDNEIARRLVVLCENTREHLLRILMGWNRDKTTDLSYIPVKEVSRLVDRMELAVSQGGSDLQLSVKRTHRAIQQVSDEIRQFLLLNIFNCDPQKWLEMSDEGELADWAKQTNTIAGKFISSLYQNSWQAIGAANTNFLPTLSPRDLTKKMHDSSGEEFIREPEWQGQYYETGPLARNHNHPLVKNLIDQYGTGLLARQVARLVALAQTPEKIEHLIAEKNRKLETVSTKGFGQIETARGQLMHSVKIRDEKIADYKILAPTEWNFHPEGIVKNSLNSLEDMQDAEKENLANMIIEAIDPCVAYQVRIS